MKKTLFLSMGLLACMAFSPQPALAEPDTGPQTVNEVIRQQQRASADLDKVQQQGVSEISILTNNSFAFERKNGQETDVFRSDHTVGNNVYLSSCMKNDLDVNKLVMTVSDYDPVLVLLPKRRTCESDDIVKDRYNFDRSNDLATAAALHSRQMVWVMKRPAWKYYYQRC